MKEKWKAFRVLNVIGAIKGLAMGWGKGEMESDGGVGWGIAMHATKVGKWTHTKDT